MPILKSNKTAKDKLNKDLITMDDVGDDAKSFFEKILGDVSKKSFTKQLIIGTSSGWLTGFLAMKVGKSAALALGGGIILLEVANQKGYININWDKVNKKIDKVSDKVEESITGQGPGFMDKAERYINRKLDKAEGNIKRGQQKAQKWYSSFTDDDKCQLKEVHIFFVSFIAGLAVGIATS